MTGCEKKSTESFHFSGCQALFFTLLLSEFMDEESASRIVDYFTFLVVRWCAMLSLDQLYDRQ